MNTKLERILPKMCCPICHEGFRLLVDLKKDDEVLEGSLRCLGGHQYGINAGVIDFGSQEQDGGNEWSVYLENADLEQLDREIEAAKSTKEKAEQLQLLRKIVEKATTDPHELIIDIASGRGMLLEKLLEQNAGHAEESIIVATDLSFEILAKDRLKFKKLYPDQTLIYMACDATNLPFANDAADMAVSFFGIANMFQLMEKGIAEASRVTKNGGLLLNAYIDIKEDSKGFEALKEYSRQQGMVGMEKVFLYEEVKNIHERYFSELVVDTVVESVYENEENSLDLLPYPGEWFAYRIYAGQK